LTTHFNYDKFIKVTKQRKILTQNNRSETLGGVLIEGQHSFSMYRMQREELFYPKK